MKRLMMATALTIAALMTSTWAQSPVDPHHPTDGAKSAPVPSNPTPATSQPGMGAPQGRTGDMPMMGVMSDMKNMMSNMSMMNMMNMMGMTGLGMGGMATMDRVEGRIAFLRAELKITDAQASAWNAFADALRANAKKLAGVPASRTPKPDDTQQQVLTMADRLNEQEQWLLARLDGTRTMKSAFTKLNEVLSDDQKKTANDLLAPHLGMGMMAMMPSQMQPERMQPPSTGNK